MGVAYNLGYGRNSGIFEFQFSTSNHQRKLLGVIKEFTKFALHKSKRQKSVDFLDTHKVSEREIKKTIPCNNSI